MKQMIIAVAALLAGSGAAILLLSEEHASLECRSLNSTRTTSAAA